MFSWVYYNSYVEPAALGVGAVLAQAMKLDTAQQVGALHGAARPARLATSAPAPGLWPGHALSCSFACLHAFLRAAGGRAGAGGGAPGELGGPEWCMALLPLPGFFCSSRVVPACHLVLFPLLARAVPVLLHAGRSRGGYGLTALAAFPFRLQLELFGSLGNILAGEGALPARLVSAVQEAVRHGPLA